MTYLDIVNNILKRLRERTVSTVNESSYSSLIAVIVNDAKESVENAWNWSALRTTLSATTTSGIFNYELNGSLNSLTVLDATNVTDNFFLDYKAAHDFNKFFLSNDVATGSPYYYSFNGVSADGDTQVDLYPIPDKAYTIRFNCVLRSDDLVNDADTLTVPTKPVELLAYAMAVEERGEDGGQSAQSVYRQAERVISDAIARDAQFTPEDLIYAPV